MVSQIKSSVFSLSPPSSKQKTAKAKNLRQSGGLLCGQIHNFAPPPHDGLAFSGYAIHTSKAANHNTKVIF
jgi:hypothetical protein